MLTNPLGNLVTDSELASLKEKTNHWFLDTPLGAFIDHVSQLQHSSLA